MKVNNIQVFGFRNAMYGMRLPKNSESLSDSFENGIGPLDLALLLSLTKAGRTHRKALRMLHVQALVEMPISWWIQYDTYKVATVANSRSRMHKMGSRELTKEDFYVSSWDPYLATILEYINVLIGIWQKTKSDLIWQQILELLPMSYQQERMLDLNYETLINILSDRYSEKLFVEWRFFCNTFLDYCPHLKAVWKASKA